MKRTAVIVIAALALPFSVFADGHGPVFGLATPTNSKGEWSFDSGVFGRSNSSDSEASFRELVGYGFTPHLTLSFTAPAVTAPNIVPGAFVVCAIPLKPDCGPGTTLEVLHLRRQESSPALTSTQSWHGVSSIEPQRWVRALKAQPSRV
jgi:hypothetical protein